MDNAQYYRSLARNLLLVMILVSFTPLILISGIIGYRFETSYRDEVIAHLRELVLKHQQNVNAFLNERLSDVRVLGDSYTYEQLSEPEFLRHQLSILQQASGGGIVDLGVVNGDGHQACYAGPYELTNADYSGAEWFLYSIRRPFYISDVFLGLRGSPHFIIALRREWKGLPWILRATVDFETFKQIVENIRVGKTGTAFIVNTQGAFQTKPRVRAPVNMEFILSQVPGIVHSASGPISEGGEDKKEWKVKLKDDSDRLVVAEGPNSAGVPTIYIMTPIKSGEWILVYQQELKDAFSDLVQSRRLAILIFVLGGLAIIVKAFILSRRMVGRIAQVDREKEMMKERMIEAGKLASLGELAAGIAHEINNPVAIMVEEAGWIEDLLDEEDLKASKNLDEVKEAVSQIKTQGKRCREITHKLLSFARRTDPRARMVLVNDMVDDVVGLTQQRAKNGNVTILKNLAPDLPLISISPSEMQQVLLNLVNNAIDAIDEHKGGAITITSRVEDDHIVVDVADNGDGIPKESLQRIFDPFYTTKPVGKGTGLGLSICYGIVKKWGGSISVDSEVAVGTSFHVVLPLLQKHKPQQ